MPTRTPEETRESVFEDRYKEERERDRKYLQLIDTTSRIDFPFDPASVADALGLFLTQYPQYSEALANPVVLIENTNEWKHTFLIEAGTAPNRSLRLVNARRMEDLNIPRTKIDFQPDLLGLVFLFEPDYEKLVAYTKIQNHEALGDNDYKEISSFLITNCPMFNKKGVEAVLSLIKQLPIRHPNAVTVRTATPKPYLDAGFRDFKRLVYGVDPFQAEDKD